MISMGIASKVNDIIFEFMKSRSFKKRGNLYFNIQNDISFCINLEQPTGLLYCTFSVMPLYMPAQVRYFTYGNRLNSFSLHPIPTLKRMQVILPFLIGHCSCVAHCRAPYSLSLTLFLMCQA